MECVKSLILCSLLLLYSVWSACIYIYIYVHTVYVQVLLQANQCDDVVQGVILVNKGEITMFTHNESTSLVCIRSIFGTHPLDDAYEKQFVLFFPTRWITSFICIFKLSDFIGSVSLSLSFPPSWRILFSVFFCFFFYIFILWVVIKSRSVAVKSVHILQNYKNLNSYTHTHTLTNVFAHNVSTNTTTNIITNTREWEATISQNRST